MGTFVRSGTLGLLLMGGFGLLRGQSPGEPQLLSDGSFATISVAAREVLLDVVATDSKGHPVEGLKASDFTVLEDGVPQSINSLSEHIAVATTTNAPPPPRLPPNAFSNFAAEANADSATIILIDALDSPVKAQMYLRQQIMAYFKTARPVTTFAIFQIDTTVHMVQGFTSDPQVLLQAVESKRDMPAIPPPMVSRYNKAREQYLTDALGLMGRYLAGFPGRKNIVWFAGRLPHTVYGLSRNPFPDAIDFDERAGRAANVQSLSRVAVYPIDDRGLEVYRSHAFGHDEMQHVADATGGRAFYETNGLKQALAQIAETSTSYYTLAYSPTNNAWNAHHREIKLVVNVRGATLLYRHGYFARKERKAQRIADAKGAVAMKAYAPAPAAGDAGDLEQAPPAGASLDAALELGALPPTELIFNASVTPATTVTRLAKGEPLPPDNYLREDFQRKPFRNYRVLFTVDPGRVSFSDSSDGHHHAQLEYAAVVYNAQGEILNSILSSRTINFTDADYRKVLHQEAPIGTELEIAVPEKGTFFLRLGVHDPITDQVGAMEIPVDAIQLGVAGPGQKLAP
jgi:VWFA-related protein